MKNICMDGSNKGEIVLTRSHGNGCERETLREKLNLLIAAQSNAIRSNYIEAKIDKIQQNCKCWLYGDKNETINHILSKSGKQVARRVQDWAWKVIQ